MSDPRLGQLVNELVQVRRRGIAQVESPTHVQHDFSSLRGLTECENTPVGIFAERLEVLITENVDTINDPVDSDIARILYGITTDTPQNHASRRSKDPRELRRLALENYNNKRGTRLDVELFRKGPERDIITKIASNILHNAQQEDPTVGQFVDRNALYITLDLLFADNNRLITLFGSPGIGKSTLARQYVHRREPAHHKILRLDCRNQGTFLETLYLEASRLGFHQKKLNIKSSTAELNELITRAIAKCTYVILDNVHDWSKLEDMVASAGIASPTVLILVTLDSDEARGGIGASIRVGPMSVAEADSLIGLRLPDASARERQMLQKLKERTLILDQVCAILSQDPREGRSQFLTELLRHVSANGTIDINAIYGEMVRKLENGGQDYLGPLVLLDMLTFYRILTAGRTGDVFHYEGLEKERINHSTAEPAGSQDEQLEYGNYADEVDLEFEWEDSEPASWRILEYWEDLDFWINARFVEQVGHHYFLHPLTELALQDVRNPSFKDGAAWLVEDAMRELLEQTDVLSDAVDLDDFALTLRSRARELKMRIYNAVAYHFNAPEAVEVLRSVFSEEP